MTLQYSSAYESVCARAVKLCTTPIKYVGRDGEVDHSFARPRSVTSAAENGIHAFIKVELCSPVRQKANYLFCLKS